MLSHLSRLAVIVVLLTVGTLMLLRWAKPPPSRPEGIHLDVTVLEDGKVELEGSDYANAMMLAAKVAQLNRLRPPPEYSIFWQTTETKAMARGAALLAGAGLVPADYMLPSPHRHPGSR